MGFDRRLFLAINRGPEAIAPAMRFFSVGLDSPWIKGLLVLVVLSLLAAGERTRRAAIGALLAWPIANGVTDLLKAAFPSLRPANDPELPSMILRIGATLSSGTASAHSANMMAVAVAFLLTLRWYGLPWLVLALLVGYSRIYNGVHYPWQVALGWMVGAFAGVSVVFTMRAVERWRRRRVDAAA